MNDFEYKEYFDAKFFFMETRIKSLPYLIPMLKIR